MNSLIIFPDVKFKDPIHIKHKKLYVFGQRISSLQAKKLFKNSFTK